MKIVVPVLALLGLTACGSSKERELKSWDLERIARAELSTKGRPAPPIDCTEHLAAYVGARTVCAIQIEGRPHDVTMTVTSVTGRQVDFDIEVAEEPRRSSTPPT